MRRIRKFLSVILATLMVISIIPITASAEVVDGTCGVNVTWTFDEATGVLTISGIGPMYEDSKNNEWRNTYREQVKTVVINDGVTRIGNYAFCDLVNLTSITLPDTLTTIGHYAIAGCDSLKSLTIPDSVTTIKHSALRGNKSLESIKLPAELTTIEDVVLSGCYNLKSITIPGKVTSIGCQAFASCDSLVSVTIPDSVKEVHQQAFYGCESLTEVHFGKGFSSIVFEYLYDGIFPYCDKLTKITVDSENQYFSTDESGVLFNKDKTKLVYYPSGLKETHYFIPQGVTRIEQYAFYDCDNLTGVTIPKTVTSIADDSFVECDSLEEIYYEGTKAEWKNVSVSNSNGSLVYASMFFYDVEYGHLHSFEAVVTPPTCTEKGYTTYTCECGYSYTDDSVSATGHRYTSEITIPATHMTEGEKTFTCSCGDTYTETIDKIAAHNYESVITEPTCTEGGYTTYTCECGHSYIGDYVDVFHRSTKQYERVITSPTCAEEGSKEIVTRCIDCNMIVNREIIAITKLPHSPEDAVEENYLAPACTINGSKDVVVYCSVCDEEISRETVTLDATGHADNDGNGYCDVCNELLDPTVGCECNCHKDGISGFFWDIKMFFSKIFRTNKMCECGVAHY